MRHLRAKYELEQKQSLLAPSAPGQGSTDFPNNHNYGLCGIVIKPESNQQTESRINNYINKSQSDANVSDRQQQQPDFVPQIPLSVQGRAGQAEFVTNSINESKSEVGVGIYQDQPDFMPEVPLSVQGHTGQAQFVTNEAQVTDAEKPVDTEITDMNQDEDEEDEFKNRNENSGSNLEDTDKEPTAMEEEDRLLATKLQQEENQLYLASQAKNLRHRSSRINYNVQKVDKDKTESSFGPVPADKVLKTPIRRSNRNQQQPISVPKFLPPSPTTTSKTIKTEPKPKTAIGLKFKSADKPTSSTGSPPKTAIDLKLKSTDKPTSSTSSPASAIRRVSKRILQNSKAEPEPNPIRKPNKKPPRCHCSVCDRAFCNPTSLLRHQVILHQMKVGNYQRILEIRCAPKSCDLCGRVLSNASHLKRHEKAHQKRAIKHCQT